MPKVRDHVRIERQIAEYEQNNPKIDQAMKLFGITMSQYQSTLHALQAPRIITVSSTAEIGVQQYGYMGHYR